MNNSDLNLIAENVREKGFFQIPEFLDKNKLETVEKILSKELTNNNKVIFPINKSQFLIKLIKFDFSTISNSKALLKIAEQLRLNTIAKSIFNSEAELYMMDTYLNKKSKNVIIPWHNDIGLKNNDEQSKKDFFNSANATINEKETDISSRGIKFFVYMTDTKSNNGALGVMPYSQHIVKTLTKLILNNKISLETYWRLENLRSLVSQKTIRHLLEEILGKEKIKKFLESSNFLNHSSDTTEFDSEMKKGGAVVFDELCVHRGSKPTENNRIVLRYLYRRKLNA